MTLVSEIIKDAYREANLIAITQSPTLPQQEEALRLFNRLVKASYGTEVGELLSVYQIGVGGVTTINDIEKANFSYPYYVPLNSRLMTNTTSALTLLLHPAPVDGARLAVTDSGGSLATYPVTLNGNGKKIDGVTTAVLNTSGLQKEWFYREDTGSWTTVLPLSLPDVFPFPLEFEDFFVISLAIRLNPRNGVVLDEQSMMQYKKTRTLFRARYAQSKEQSSEAGLSHLTWRKGISSLRSNS